YVLFYNYLFFFQQKTANDLLSGLVGLEMCIRDKKRHSLFGLHDKYECVYFSFAFAFAFAFASKIIRTLNITAHHPPPA
ncbi:hypothetical protein UQ13_03360, partial [Escherichia coli]|uniref:hypothetical protein n=1 Tax=Escherichia coli TaxID=562 RepID=UPI000B3F1765